MSLNLEYVPVELFYREQGVDREVRFGPLRKGQSGFCFEGIFQTKSVDLNTVGSNNGFEYLVSHCEGLNRRIDLVT